MRLAILVNPVSGNGLGGRLEPALRGFLQREGYRAEVHRTGGPGDAMAWARDRHAAYDRILVVGGDGTLNEVLNGLPDPSLIPITQLATGTANLLTRDLGLPRDPERSARMLVSGDVRRIDMGLAGERRFLLVASAGFDAMVTRDIARTRSSTLGYRGYVQPTLRALRGYRPPRILVEVDDRPPVEGQMVVASNTRNYGGLFTLADRARLDSGHFDVLILQDASLSGLVKTGVAGLTGGLSRRDDVKYLTGRRVRIRADPAVPVEIDGDFAGTTPLDLELVPSVVPIVVPAGRAVPCATLLPRLVEP